MNQSFFDRSDYTPNTAIVTAGHVVIDQVIDTIDQEKPRISLGGPSSYSSVVLKSLGYQSFVITKVGSDFPKIYSDFLKERGGFNPERVKVSSCKTTSYKIDRTTSPRRMWLLAKCKPLTFHDFEPVLEILEHSREKTLILNPVAGEISLSLLDRISKEFEFVLVDSQGFVRRISPRTSEVTIKQGLDISSLSGVNVLKADREEIAGWTGSTDLEKSIIEISKFVDTILLTSGPGEVDVYVGGKRVYRATPPEVASKDTTGAGDIMLACFAARYSETKDIERALSFAVCAASLAVRKVGIEKSLLTKAEVLKRARDTKIAICR